MAWWRERLEELDSGTVPAEPRLRAVQRQLLGRGICGSELSKLEDAWLPLLEPVPWGDPAGEGLRYRGRILFGIGARLLGGDPRDAADCEPAGALWSLVDGARHCSHSRSRQFLLDEARKSIADLPRQKPRQAMRRITVLAALAAYDVFRGKPLDSSGGLGRVSVASAHLLFGSITRE